MNLPYFVDLRWFKVGPRPKNTNFGPVSSTILAVLKGPENLAYVFIQKGEANKTSNYQKGKSNKMPTLKCHHKSSVIKFYGLYQKQLISAKYRFLGNR